MRLGRVDDGVLEFDDLMLGDERWAASLGSAGEPFRQVDLIQTGVVSRGRFIREQV